MKSRTRIRWARLVAVALCVSLFCGITAAWFLGSALCSPRLRAVSRPSALPLEDVSFKSESGATLHGWALRAHEAKGVVVLMHGIRGTRLDMLRRAQWLHGVGYHTLVFDFQAHGESAGSGITFGYLESRDAKAAVEFARRYFGTDKIAAIGGSLGGAAMLLAQPELNVRAMVLESVYPTITEAVEDRCEIVAGPAARVLAPLLTCQLRPRIGCCARDLSPIERVANIRIPKLILYGAEDQHTKVSESREIFRRAAEPKEQWEIAGAAHIDLHQFAPRAYEERVLRFLDRYLNE